MKLKKQLYALKPYQPGKSIDEVKKQYGLDDIIKLASNENPSGSSPYVLDAIRNLEIPLSMYPNGYASNLRTALADFLKITPEQLMFGNGSDEIIQIISRSLLDTESNTVMASPTFPQYKHNAIIEGAEIREVPLINGVHDLQAMLNSIDEKTSVVWLCSPNNPTGTYINNDQIHSFLDQVPSNVLVVLDEAYYEYVDISDYYDSLELIKSYENLIVLRTFSKIYGLAALRVGYAVSNPRVIAALEPTREPFNVNSLAQIAAAAAVNDQSFVEKCKKANREGMQLFYNFCHENDLSYYPSQGNFILVDLKVDGDDVFQFLLERGCIVRSGKALGFPTAVRITVGSQEQNEAVLMILKEFLKQRKNILENVVS